MDYDPYVSPMSREDWNEVKRLCEGVRDTVDSVRGWDRTSEVVSVEVEEVDKGIAASLVFKFGGQVACITVFGRSFPHVFATLREFVFGQSYLEEGIATGTRKLTLDKGEVIN